MRQLVLLLACFGLTACISSPNRCEAIMPSDPASETYDPSLGVDLSQMTKTVNGVYEQDIVVGDGATLTAPVPVAVYYIAYLTNGTIVDQKLNAPFLFDLRTSTTPGVVDGMMGMSEGGRRMLVVPSQLALGPCRNGPIPPNSTLVYQIELIAINP